MAQVHTKYRMLKWKGPPRDEPPVPGAVQQGKSPIWLAYPGEYDIPEDVDELPGQAGKRLAFPVRNDLSNDHPLKGTRAAQTVPAGSPQVIYNDDTGVLEIWSPEGNIPITDEDFEPVDPPPPEEE